MKAQKQFSRRKWIKAVKASQKSFQSSVIWKHMSIVTVSHEKLMDWVPILQQ